MTLAIIGAGSHARSVAEIARVLGLRYEFYDDDPERGKPVTDADSYVLAVNDPQTRHKLALRLPGPPVTLIHPKAVIGSDCRIGRGVVIQAGVILTADVHLGDHVHLNVGATVSQGSTLGDFVGLGPGAHVCGECEIGARTYIGAGATVKHLTRIGADAVIGCGAAVVSHVPDAMIYAGVPAKPLV